MECKCYIGMLLDYENTDNADLITREELEEEIKKGVYSREDYYNLSLCTNLMRFNYCPNCGKKIDWEAMKLDK